MTVNLTPELEKAALDEAKKLGRTPQDIVLEILRDQLLPAAAQSAVTAPDEWEMLLTSAAVDCGVSLSDDAVSSDGLYD